MQFLPKAHPESTFLFPETAVALRSAPVTVGKANLVKSQTINSQHIQSSEKLRR